MYVNAKMINVETIPGIGGWKDKGELCGVNSSMIYSTHCKNCCKCHNVPQLSTIIKKCYLVKLKDKHIIR
jgi:hypothetical protein